MCSITVVDKPEQTCFICLGVKNDIQVIKIPSMGWGSTFDCWSTQVNLCQKCYSDTNQDWWSLEICEGNSDMEGSWYKYENEIIQLINGLSLAAQELFYNTYASDGNWDGQDWIDYRLNKLPYKKCKEYGVYSYEEISAYRERYPSCQHPVNIVHPDQSKGSRCPFGALGKYGGKADEYNIWNDCYMCEHFMQRTEPIKEINNSEYSDYMIYYQSKIKSEELAKKFKSL